MTHCTIDQLTDHLLAQAAEAERIKVENHLGTGCQRCNQLLARLSQVRSLGIFDLENCPPDEAVRTVKALSGFARSRRRSRVVKMRLSFDSLLSPSLAGARSQPISGRHLVYFSQEFALDLRMDYERSLSDMVVVGQLHNRDWGPLSDVPAYLVSGERVISHSTTGRLGEFHMECRPRGPMHLRLAVSDTESIDIELDRRTQRELRTVPVEPDAPDPHELADSIQSRSTDIPN